MQKILLCSCIKKEIAQDKCLENRTCPGFNTHIIMRPARGRNVRGKTSGFAMVKRKSRDVFPYLGDQPGKYIKNRFKREGGMKYSSCHVVRNSVHIGNARPLKGGVLQRSHCVMSALLAVAIPVT